MTFHEPAIDNQRVAESESCGEQMSDDSQQRKQGLLLVGHGTRDARGIGEFLQTSELVAKLRPDLAVEPCFLELATPTIGTAIDRMAARGVGELTVAPLLMFAAGHAKQDIPDAVSDAAAGYPQLRIRQVSHLGLHPLVLRVSADRYLAAIAKLSDVPSEDNALLMVGRGSLDDTATAEMHEFVERRVKLTPVAGFATGFVAMAKPTLDEAAACLVAKRPRQIVVQPHLLFHGELLATVKKFVDDAPRRFDSGLGEPVRWCLAEHLGVDVKIAAATVERLEGK